MILVYIALLILTLYNAKIYKPKEYNNNFLNKQTTISVKGLCAILIVLHHTSQRIENPDQLVYFRWIGYLCVSMFLFYSGYGLYMSYNNNNNYINTFCKKRISKIIVPFILSNILFIFSYKFINKNTYTIMDIINYSIGFKLIDGFKWYVITSIVFYYGFYLIFKYANKNKLKIMTIFITIYVLVCYIMRMGSYWYNASYTFILGMVMAKYHKSIFNFIKKQYINILIIVAVIFKFTFMKTVYEGNLIPSIISSISFVLLSIIILTKISISNKILLFIGNISYEIYLVHGLILNLLFNITNNKYLYLISVMVISILTAYLFKLSLNKTIYFIKYIRNKFKIQNNIYLN